MKVDPTKPQPLPRELKLGVTAAFTSVALFCFGAYFILPRDYSYQDKGKGYSVDYRTWGKKVSVTLHLEETLENDAEKLGGLAVRVQETGQTAPLTKKNKTYSAALTPPESYTLLVYGKAADGKEVPVTTLHFPPAK